MEQIKVFNGQSIEETEKQVNEFLLEQTNLEFPDNESIVKETQLQVVHLPIGQDPLTRRIQMTSIYTVLIRYSAPQHMSGIERQENAKNQS